MCVILMELRLERLLTAREEENDRQRDLAPRPGALENQMQSNMRVVHTVWTSRHFVFDFAG